MKKRQKLLSDEQWSLIDRNITCRQAAFAFLQAVAITFSSILVWCLRNNLTMHEMNKIIVDRSHPRLRGTVFGQASIGQIFVKLFERHNTSKTARPVWRRDARNRRSINSSREGR